jgi:hypothetical protein
MKKVKVVLDFIKLSVAEEIAFFRSVISKLTGNETFPTPDVPLTDAKKAVDDLESSFIAAKDGSHTAVSLMHDNKEAAEVFFRSLAAYVDRNAAGDETKILSSGFHVSKQPVPAVRPEFSVELGEKSGSVLLRRQKVEGAHSYIWQSCKSENPGIESDWSTAMVTTQVSTEITGLTPLTKYWFRVAAVTIDGTGAFCDPIMQVVI